MTENPNEGNPPEDPRQEGDEEPQPVQPLPAAPTSRKAVYDHGELRFVDPVAGETAAATAKRLNADNAKGRKVGRADGKSGKRYDVVDV